MRTLLLVGFVVFWAVQAEAQDTPKVLEKYQCQGTGANGEYKTPLTIEKKGDSYILRWTDSFGEGFRYNDELVAFFIVGDVHGVILYQILDGRLVGAWYGEGETRTYREFCVAGQLVEGEPDETQTASLLARGSSQAR